MPPVCFFPMATLVAALYRTGSHTCVSGTGQAMRSVNRRNGLQNGLHSATANADFETAPCQFPICFLAAGVGTYMFLLSTTFPAAGG